MPKSEFEFYQLPGIPEEFVIPKPASDPYHGQHHPKDAGELVIAAIVEAISGHVDGEPEVEVTPTKGAPMRSYLFNQIPASAEVVGSAVKMMVEIDEEESSYYSSTMGSLASLLTSVTHEVTPTSASTDSFDSRAEAIKVIRDPASPEAYTAIYDDKDRPKHPNIKLQQIIPVRAYRWLPGPERKSASKVLLPPTYSPRPVSIVFAQTVEIVGRNPLVQTTAPA